MKKKPIETTCNESCDKPFTIKKLKVTKLHGGIEKTHFHCPHCKHEYVCYYTDNSVRKLQADMRELYIKLKQIKTEEETDELLLEMETLKKTILAHMSSIKGLVEANTK